MIERQTLLLKNHHSRVQKIGVSCRRRINHIYSFTQLRTLFLTLFILCLTTDSFSQFCENWSLAASTAQTGSSGAATTGNTEVIGSGMSTPTYSNSGGFSWQRFGTPGGNPWPNTVNTANGIYLEFPITPTAGNNLVINSITFSTFMSNSSGSLIFNVYDGTTAIGTTATISSGSSATPDNVSITGLSISVTTGTTKYIRLYITAPTTTSTRTLNIRNVAICGTSASASCAQATLAGNSAVAAGNISAGTSNNILNNFSIYATTNLTLTGVTFPFTNTGLVTGDLVNFKLYYTATNSFTSPTLLSTVTTGLTTSPISFTSLSQSINTSSIGYFWVTADVASGATAGHTITASALTAANLTFSGTPTTCGSVAAQGTKTINIITLPTVTTTAASSITSSTASSGGNVTSDGGSPIISRGLIYSIGPITDTNSTTGGGKIVNGTASTGAFTSALTGLVPGTTYHIRSYAVNALGVSYGTDLTFTTPAAAIRNCGGSGPLNGSGAREGTFYLYAYVKAGEKIDWNVIRTENNSAGNWTINVYTPTGLYSTCTIGTVIGNSCSNAQITITAATEGIWTLQAIPAGTNGNDVVCPSLNVYNSGGTVIPGRV